MDHGKRVPFEALINTRDLGGFPAADGRRIREKAILRSGELFKATGKDLEQLKIDYALNLVIDFRTPMEREMKPDPEISGVRYVFDPILQEETMGITREEEARGEEQKGDWLDVILRISRRIGKAPEGYMESMYQALAGSAHARAGYGQFLKLLAQQNGGCALYHCTAGKDRVGVGTAFLLMALGVPRELILEDFLMTNEYYRETNRQMTEELYRRGADDGAVNAARELYQVSESCMKGVFDVIDQEAGSSQEFLTKALGFDEVWQEKLKEKYLI